MRISETINYIAPVRLSFLLSAWYKLKSPGKIECQWKNGLHQFVLRTYLGGIVLTDDWYVCVLQHPQRHEGQGFKRKLAEQRQRESTSKQFPQWFLFSCSLKFCPGFHQELIVTWKYEPNNVFPTQLAFGHGVYHNIRKNNLRMTMAGHQHG